MQPVYINCIPLSSQIHLLPVGFYLSLYFWLLLLQLLDSYGTGGKTENVFGVHSWAITSSRHNHRLRKMKLGCKPRGQIRKKYHKASRHLHVSITYWYGYCSASDRKALQMVVRTDQYITGPKLSPIQDCYTRRCPRKALNIVRLHPSQS